MKMLVAFFSAQGTTGKLARAFAQAQGADVFEIVPEKPYTPQDLNWKNPLSRVNREKLTNRDVTVAGSIENFDQYDTVFLGFPIWYGAAPNVINTFCKGYDWTDKRVYAFATSGGSGIGRTGQKLMPLMPNAKLLYATLVHSEADLEDLARRL